VPELPQQIPAELVLVEVEEGILRDGASLLSEHIGDRIRSAQIRARLRRPLDDVGNREDG
jgi:hypothetical protein